ncbi:hypothetical protein BKK79_24235 [Cupriavidus sp. USMAA2-4]|uniref:hypothetical protein n=1 Tax=Cupriavidus sp. USMAA2-4 TaxID=876364 RepID=UPI0008A6B405|nr:hypothetical protein [Cupriavidus sp. USMAA2-4]AOY94959.1 hypothetical protein BKK79_24235 [Cupriavidus sp. USMAA2-4]
MKFSSKGKLAVFSLYGLVLLVGVFSVKWMYAMAQFSQGGGSPLFPPEMNAVRDAKTAFVIGDLGGVPVRIPHHFANYVEYDGDPGFGEKRKESPPPRTYQSRLSSFGFMVRFPDMAGRSSPELWKDYENYGDPYWTGYYDSISPWIDVGLSSGERYPGDGFLERAVSAKLRFNAEREGYPALATMNFAEVPGLEHGLTVYASPGTDSNTGKPYRQDDYAKDLFVHRGKDGKVDTYIECTNRNLPNLKYTTCKQNVGLAPEMHAKIYIQYPRYWLPHWREIQRSVSDLVLSFKVESSSTDSVSPPPDLLRRNAMTLRWLDRGHCQSVPANQPLQDSQRIESFES